MWDWQETKKQIDSADTESCHLQRGQDTSPLSVQWRLEERKWWISGTPWPNLEAGAGPADHYLPPAHRALWSECRSEEVWHLRHFPLWVRTSWPNPRPRPSVLPKICREMSANLAARCWSGDQAVGLGRRPLPHGWFCGISWTKDLTCTAVDRWRRRRRSALVGLLQGKKPVQQLNIGTVAKCWCWVLLVHPQVLWGRTTELYCDGNWVLQQDNVLAYTTLKTVQVFGPHQTVLYPSYLPDLAPCIFFFLPKIKFHPRITISTP